MESPIKRSAKAVISRNLTTSLLDWLLVLPKSFIYLSFFFIFTFYIYIYIYRKQALPSHLHSNSTQCCWLAWMNKKKTYVYFFNGYPLPAHMGNKWLLWRLNMGNCCGDWIWAIAVENDSALLLYDMYVITFSFLVCDMLSWKDLSVLYTPVQRSWF